MTALSHNCTGTIAATFVCATVCLPSAKPAGVKTTLLSWLAACELAVFDFLRFAIYYQMRISHQHLRCLGCAGIMASYRRLAPKHYTKYDMACSQLYTCPFWVTKSSFQLGFTVKLELNLICKLYFRGLSLPHDSQTNEKLQSSVWFDLERVWVLLELETPWLIAIIYDVVVANFSRGHRRPLLFKSIWKRHHHIVNHDLILWASVCQGCR